jgi:hypothetical protein
MCRLYLDARKSVTVASGRVTKWNDMRAGGHYFDPLTAGLGPTPGTAINGIATIDFDTTDQQQLKGQRDGSNTLIVSDLILNDRFTVSYCGVYNGSHAEDTYLLNPAVIGDIRGGAGYWMSTMSTTKADIGVTLTGSVHKTAKATITTGTPFYIVQKLDSGTLYYRLNGATSWTAGDASASPIENITNGVGIGTSYVPSNASLRLKGSVGGLVVANDVCSDEQARTLGLFWKNAWAL